MELARSEFLLVSLSNKPENVKIEEMTKYLTRYPSIIDFIHDSSHRSALMNCAVKDNPECIEYLHHQGASLELRDLNGNTALMLTIKNNCPRALKKLLELKANMNCQDKNGVTPLLEALQTCKYDLAEVLLIEGADLLISDNDGNNVIQFTPLTPEQRSNKLMLKADPSRYEALRSKIIQKVAGDIHIVEEFHRLQQIISHLSKTLEECEQLRNSTSADESKFAEQIEKCQNELTVATQNLSSFKNFVGTFCHYIKDHDHESMVQQRRGTKPANTMIGTIFHAIKEGNLSGVQQAVKDNVALLYMFDEASHKETPLLYACWLDNEEIASYLVREGSDVNYYVDDHLEPTPFFSACCNKNLRLCKLLIEFGADWTFVNPKTGRCALDEYPDIKNEIKAIIDDKVVRYRERESFEKQLSARNSEEMIEHLREENAWLLKQNQENEHVIQELTRRNEELMHELK